MKYLLLCTLLLSLAIDEIDCLTCYLCNGMEECAKPSTKWKTTNCGTEAPPSEPICEVRYTTDGKYVESRTCTVFEGDFLGGCSPDGERWVCLCDRDECNVDATSLLSMYQTSGNQTESNQGSRSGFCKNIYVYILALISLVFIVIY